MAKNVIIHGVTYQDVPTVNIPLADGEGSAKFVDTDSGNAAASDLRAGKKAWAGGNEVTGSVPEKTASDVAVSGKNITVPAGIYDSEVQRSVADGSVTPGASVSGDEIGDTVSDYEITVTPSAAVSAGYVSGDKTGAAVTKYIQVEEKSAAPSMAQQSITPSAGKLLKKVTVAAVVLDGNASAGDVLSGKTFYNSSLTKITGTATVPVISQDPVTKVLSVS